MTAGSDARPMLSGFKIEPRFPDGDHVVHWWPGTEMEQADRYQLVARDSIAQGWEPISAYTDDEDAPDTDVCWFTSFLAMSEAEGDPVVREILSRSGEWLPLAGDAEGLSMFHPLQEAEVDLDRCERGPKGERGKGSIETYAIDHNSVVADQVSFVPGLGLMWFENTYEGGLRSRVAEQSLTGIGFIKCWDDSGAFRYDSSWWLKELDGIDVWS